VTLNVDSIKPCTFSADMMNELQISPSRKRLLEAVCHAFEENIDRQKPPLSPLDLGPWFDDRTMSPTATNPRYWSSDFVPGKGQGQIVLLHGKPGVGKTTAAECVAELARSPLLTVTCGDLGTDPLIVEKELKRWLRLGTLCKFTIPGQPVPANPSQQVDIV
jgi:hypothetical protein